MLALILGLPVIQFLVGSTMQNWMVGRPGNEARMMFLIVAIEYLQLWLYCAPLPTHVYLYIYITFDAQQQIYPM